MLSHILCAVDNTLRIRVWDKWSARFGERSGSGWWGHPTSDCLRADTGCLFRAYWFYDERDVGADSVGVALDAMYP